MGMIGALLRREVLALAGTIATVGGARALGGPTRPRLQGGDAWRWAIDYGAATDAPAARGYDLLVLEPDHPRPIAPLRGPGAALIGYISLGEVERGRPFVAELERAGALLAPNPHWPDARYADIRHRAWRSLFLDRLVPGVLAKGYDGVFLDTIDNAEALERADPAANAGMVAAAASLVAALRRRFPQAVVMMNRGYAILPEVAPAIDVLLGEAMASRWSFAERRYERLSDDDWAWQASRMRAAKARNPALLLATLDYWEPGDAKAVAALYARERAQGFNPYVSVLALDKLIAEPPR